MFNVTIKSKTNGEMLFQVSVEEKRRTLTEIENFFKKSKYKVSETDIEFSFSINITNAIETLIKDDSTEKEEIRQFVMHEIFWSALIEDDFKQVPVFSLPLSSRIRKSE